MKFYVYLKSIVFNLSSVMKLGYKCLSLINRFIKNTTVYQIETSDYQKARNVYLINYGKSQFKGSESDKYAVEVYELYEKLYKEQQKELREFYANRSKELYKREEKARRIEFEKHISTEKFTEIVNHKRTTDFEEYGLSMDDITKDLKSNQNEFNKIKQ